MLDEALDLLGPMHGDSNSSSSARPAVANSERAPVHQDEEMASPAQPSAPADAPAPFAAPVAPDEGASADVVAGPDEIILDGTRIDSNSSLAVLKAACDSLGVSVHDSRAQVFKRLVQHLKKQEMVAAHSVKHNLSKELQRSVSQPGVPAEPSEEEVHEHNATHIPFKAWCELSVAQKERQDHHHRESHTSPAHTVVSLDFGYADGGADDSLTIFFIHDISTKMMHAVPTAAKGGRSLPYLTQELCRFGTWLGHQEVCFELTMNLLSLLDPCKRALKGLGVHVTVELAVPGNKEANGAAEVTVQTIRNQANLLIEQVERSLGAHGRVLFGALHPLYS